MEQIVEQAYLYDFYGELLNARQQKIYEDFIFHDLSLSEIAEEEGISRQGVYDMVRRCTKTLEGYEQKLHLVEKFLHTKERVAQIHALTRTCCSMQDMASAEQVSGRIRGPAEEERQCFPSDQVLAEKIRHTLSKIEQISNQILEEL